MKNNYVVVSFTFYSLGDIRIKFNTDPRLSDAECKRLLQKYMSDHVKETKLTQKLFIQYVEYNMMHHSMLIVLLSSFVVASCSHCWRCTIAFYNHTYM